MTVARSIRSGPKLHRHCMCNLFVSSNTLSLLHYGSISTKLPITFERTLSAFLSIFTQFFLSLPVAGKIESIVTT